MYPLFDFCTVLCLVHMRNVPDLCIRCHCLHCFGQSSIVHFCVYLWEFVQFFGPTYCAYLCIFLAYFLCIFVQFSGPDYCAYLCNFLAYLLCVFVQFLGLPIVHICAFFWAYLLYIFMHIQNTHSALYREKNTHIYRKRHSAFCQHKLHILHTLLLFFLLRITGLWVLQC